MSEKLTGLAALRAPFPAHQISKLPKPTKAQTEAIKADYKKGIRCKLCGTWHHPEVVHLDYVGHAALTDRLLDADPAWTWEPLAMSPEGLPVFDGFGGMWIKLHVCGITRMGYGAAEGKDGPNAIKEVIGDALRNAAMRFGAALDLWHKGDLHADDLPENDRTLIMKVRNSISDHIANERDMGALQEWEIAKDMGEAFATAVWSGLTTPDRDKLRELSGKPTKQAKEAA